jgi:gliding motility-associated-like protein
MKDNVYYLFNYKVLIGLILLINHFELVAFQNQITFDKEELEVSVKENIIRYEFEFKDQFQLNLKDLDAQSDYLADYSIIEGAVDAFMISGKSGTLSKSELGSFKLEKKKLASLHFSNSGKGIAKVSISIEKILPQQDELKIMSNLTVNQSVSPTQLVEDIFIGGDCYDVDAVEFSGHNSTKGSFSNGQTSVGISDGIILGSGFISNAIGPNNTTNVTTQVNTSGDNDLKILANNAPVYDAAVLEFDFVPTTDTVKFRYVFASEEYCDYSNSNYNDVFGFFLSGPGISGPYSNGAENIAKLPNGQDVTINNVNHVNNPAFYVSNTIPSTNTGFRCNGNPLGSEPAISELQYDAFTVVLDAVAVVQPCQTYHIKLAIADVYDRKFDSAVFLESNSFTSGEQIQAGVVNEFNGEQSGFEGCNIAMYEFCRQSAGDNAQDLEVLYSLDVNSTASPGTDFANFPLSVTIPAGSDCVSLPIELFDDDIVEGTETIILNLEQSCSCSSNDLTFEIQDKAQIVLAVNNEEICQGTSVSLTADAFGGTNNYSYAWETGETTKSIIVSPTVTTDYSVTVTDDCGLSEEKIAQVNVLSPPSASLSGNGSICADQSNTVQLEVELLGNGPWTLIYSKDGVTQPEISVSEAQYNLEINESGLYALVSVVEQGKSCFGTVDGSVIVGETNLELEITKEDLNCFGAATGSLQLSMDGGEAPYIYEWSDLNLSGNAPANLAAGVYQVTITDNNGCQINGQETIIEPEELSVQISDIVHINCEQITGTASALASGGANPIFNYAWSNGGVGAQLEVLEAGEFHLTVTDGNQCTHEATVVIAIDTASVVDLSDDTYVIDCNNPSTQINGLIINSSAELEFQWTTTDGNISSSSTDQNPIVDAGGIYSYEVFNPVNGCIHNAEVEVIADFQLPVADAGLTQELNCDITEITLNGNNSDLGSNYVYNWSSSDGNIINGTEGLNPLVDAPGSYILTVTNLNSGCFNSSSVIISEDVSQPQFNLYADNEVLTCLNTSVDLSYNLNENINLHTVLWTYENGDPILSGSNGSEISVNAPGLYTLEIKDASNGCSSVEEILIGQDVEEPLVNVIVLDVLDCTTSDVTIDGVGSSEGPMFEYAWEDPDGILVPNANTLSFSANQAGNYTLTVTNTQNHCVVSKDVLVSVDTIAPNLNLSTNQNLDCIHSEILIESEVTEMDNIYYEWSDPAGLVIDNNNPSLVVDSPGVYELLVLNELNGCSTISSVDVIEDVEEPSISVEPMDKLDCVDLTQLIEVVNNSAGSGFEYSWTTDDGNIVSGSTGIGIIADAPGAYNVEVLNSINGCLSELTVYLEQDVELPEVQVGEANDLTCTEQVIELNAEPSSNESSYLYNWTSIDGSIVSGNETLNPSVNAAGSYVLTVTDINNGCSSSLSTTVNQNVTLPVPVIENEAELSCDLNEVILSGIQSEGNQLSYEWRNEFTGEIISTTSSATAFEPGVYSLKVVDNNNGCEQIVESVVNQNIIQPNVSIEPTDELTCSVTEVSIEGLLSTESGNFEIEWFAPNGDIISGQGTNILEVASSGTYVLVVEDPENGCVTEVSTVVGSNLTKPALSVEEPEKLTCLVTQVSLVANLEYENYAYQALWTDKDDNVIAEGQQLTIEVTEMGAYGLEIQNTQNGCKSSTELYVDVDYEIPESSVMVADKLNCVNQEVEILGEVYSSNGQLTLSWRDPDFEVIPGENLENLTVAEEGLYTIIVFDNVNGCISQSSVLVELDTVYPDLDLSVDDILTCTNTHVDIEALCLNTSVYYSEWTDPQGLFIAENISNVTVELPGYYTWRVRNPDNGCESVEQILVEQDSEIPSGIIGSVNPLNCTNSVVDLNVSVIGSGNYSYSWSTVDGDILGANDQALVQVTSAGVYELDLLNTLNGCSVKMLQEVVSDTEEPELVFDQQDQLTCQNDMVLINGELMDGGATYVFDWLSPSGVPVDYNGVDPLVSESGTYWLTVLDTENGCTAEYTVEIEENKVAPEANLIGVESLSCYVTEIFLDASLSQGSNLNFEWLDLSSNYVVAEGVDQWQTSEPGTYALVVKDLQNGCFSQLDFTVDQDINTPEVSIVGPDTLTCILNEVDLIAGVSSSGSSLNYSWFTNGALLQQGGENNIEVNAPGVYTLIVEDLENGCTSSIDQIVFENIQEPFAVILTPEEINCDTDQVSLEAEISNVVGGVYNVEWVSLDGLLMTDPETEDAIAGAAGLYTLTVYNTENQCSFTTFTEVEENTIAPIVDAGNDFTLPCFEDVIALDGFVQTNSSNYEVLWSSDDGQILSGASSLNPEITTGGIYTIEVLDISNGCLAFDQIRVTEALPFEVNVDDENPLCFGDYGSIEVTDVDSNHSGPFVYSVDGGENFGPEAVFEYLNPGAYDVVVQDINGCWSEVKAIQILNPEELDVQTDAEVFLEQGESYLLYASVNYPINEISSITWSPAEGLDCADCLSTVFDGEVTQSYEVEVTTVNGCVDRSLVTIYVDQTPKVYIPNIFTPNGEGSNDIFMITADPKTVDRVTKFEIYDRWGEKMICYENFEPNDPKYGWDGVFKGQLCNAGVFIYYAEILMKDGRLERFKGDITISK